MNLIPDNATEISMTSIDIPSISSILEKIILGGVFFILALPLLGDYGSWLFPIGRDIIFKISVEFLAVILLMFWLFKKPQFIMDLKSSFSPITLFLMLFLSVMVMSTIFSVQPEFSFWGNIYKNQGLLTWTHYVFFFFILISLVKDKSILDLFIKFSIFVALIVSIIALWQILQGGFGIRPGATLNNPNFLASYLILVVPLTFAFLIKKPSSLLVIALITQLFALLATQTRGAYLGIVSASIIFAYLKTHNKIRRVVPKLPITNYQLPLLLIFSGIILIIFTSTGQSLQQKFPDFTDRFLSRESIVNSSSPRLEAWRTGFKGIMDRPILGYGPENFFVAFDKHYSGKFDHTGSLETEGSLWETWFDKAHNFIFDIGVTAGVLGLIAYFGIFASAAIMLFKIFRTTNGELKIIGIALVSALSGYLVQNLFEFDTLVPGIYLILILAYSNFFVTFNNEMLNKLQPIGVGPRSAGSYPDRLNGFLLFKVNIKYLLLTIIPFTFAAFIYSIKIHTEMLRANHQLNISYEFAKQSKITEMFSSVEKGLVYNSPPINPNLRRQYAIFALAYSNAVLGKCQSNSAGSDPAELDCAELVKDSEKFLEKALELQEENAATIWPYFTRNYIYAAQIAHKLKRYDESDNFLKKAADLSPNRKSIHTERERLLIEGINHLE